MRSLRNMVLLLAALGAAMLWAQDGPAAGEREGREAREAREGPDDRRDNRRDNRRRWDPAQMQERMLTYQKTQLGLADAEWEAIKPLLVNVMQKQRALRDGQGIGFMRGRRERPGEAAEEPTELSPGQVLAKAVEAKDEAAIKQAMTALRAARAASEAELKTAREALREVLTLEQEAKLVLSGLLD